MSEYLEPEKDQANNRSEKNKQGPTSSPKDSTSKKDTGKKGRFQVLHEDGSLADLPDQHVKGGGALKGTVGLGT